MNGTPKEMAILARGAAAMRTDNHGRYLAELMRWYRHAALAGPVEAADSLDFLAALWKTPVAGRVEELIALNDVGRWLEDRLWEDPAMSAERLAWQIGWLRRIANTDEEGPSRVQPRDAPGGRHEGRPPEPSRSFGAKAGQIRERRKQAARTWAKVGAPGAATPKETPTVLDTGALLRIIDKSNASAKVPEVLKGVPAPQQPAVAREIVKKLGGRWVEDRREKAWAADLLAIASKT